MPERVKTPAAADTAARPVIDAMECKGCGRCVAACPKGVLAMSKRFNARGVHYAEYAGADCVGCCACFYSCPEPWALEVHLPARPAKRMPATTKDPQ